MNKADDPFNAGKPDEVRVVPTAVRWHILFLLMAYSFMSWFNRVSMSTAADLRIMKDFQITETQIGFVYSALLFAYALCMTPGGWMADRYGAWIALVFMGFGSALFCGLTGLVGFESPTAVLEILGLQVSLAWLSLMVIRSVMGVFTAPIYPASGRIIMHWIPFRQRAAANGWVMSAALVGIACAPVAFGALIDRFDWPAAFAFSGLITGLLALHWTLYAKNYPAQHSSVNSAELRLIGNEATQEPLAGKSGPSAPTGSWLTLLRNRSLVLLTLSYSAVGYFEYLFYFWMHYYFDEVLKVGEQRSRFYAGILYLSMAAGMPVGGWLSDRLQLRFGYRRGRVLVPVGGMLASAGLLLLGIKAENPLWIVVWFALAMAAIGATEGPFWATALDLGGRRGGTSAGIFNTGGNAGGILAPILTPWVSQQLGWTWGISLGSLYCLLGVVLWWWIDPRERVPDGD
jgi:ACS family glucarate transporter-like MFS transporter